MNIIIEAKRLTIVVQQTTLISRQSNRHRHIHHLYYLSKDPSQNCSKFFPEQERIKDVRFR